jgi:hypothetical protein
MPKQQTHVGVVRRWCQSLAVLTAVSMTREEAQLRLAAFVPLLVDRFPDGAFTTASLEHCAAQAVKGFPTYGELAGWLAAWWREHRPYVALPPPPPPPPRPEPTPEEIEHVRRAAAEAVAALRSSAQPIEDRRPMPRYLTPAQLDAMNPLPNGRKRVA